MNMRRFVEENRIRIMVEWADDNPNMEGSENMNNYKCVLKMGRKQLTVPFSMGFGLTREPDAKDVLDCLALDSAGYENARDFEDWCGEYGYDTDSRKAERTYKIIGTQSIKLKKFLGDELYEELLWKTDRL